MKKEEMIEEWHKCISSFEYWRDKYVRRVRTKNDWPEICKQMSITNDTSLSKAVETYKEDRQKWIDWYNDNFVFND